ncbi:MAG: ribonuclease HII [Candidatus Babeliales bacterium]
MKPRKNAIIITGIDDATKCPCIGSIFVAGVVADKTTIARWKKLGVKDSKLVAPKKRFNHEKIIKETALAYSNCQITPAMIDDKSLNLNDWEMVTVFNILKELYQKQSMLGDVHVDNWETSTKGFNERFARILSDEVSTQLHERNIAFDKEQLRATYFLPEHRADELYTIVGAASILAKTSSDIQYQEYKKIYGDFGSGSPADPKTRFFVWQHRQNPLPIIRKSWNTFKTLVKLTSITQDPLYKIKKKKAKDQITISNPS